MSFSGDRLFRCDRQAGRQADPFSTERTHCRITRIPTTTVSGTLPHGIITIWQPSAKTWQWGLTFMIDVLCQLRALMWPHTLSAGTFIELALDFEEFAERTISIALQAKFRGNALPLQERARGCTWHKTHCESYLLKAHRTHCKRSTDVVPQFS